MNRKIKVYSFVLLLALQLINCESKNSDNEEKQRAIAGVLINNLTAGTSSSTSSSSSSSITCSSSAPGFSTLAAAGVTSNCARSGCHVGSSPQSGLDMTSYNSVLSRVTAKNGAGSLVYQKINGGSMQTYTTSQITTAVFCWIQGGALP